MEAAHRLSIHTPVLILRAYYVSGADQDIFAWCDLELLSIAHFLSSLDPSQGGDHTPPCLFLLLIPWPRTALQWSYLSGAGARDFPGLVPDRAEAAFPGWMEPPSQGSGCGDPALRPLLDSKGRQWLQLWCQPHPPGCPSPTVSAAFIQCLSVPQPAFGFGPS